MKALLVAIGRAVLGDVLARVGALALIIMVAVAVLAPWIAPYQPTTVHYRGEGALLVRSGGAWLPPRFLSGESLLGVTGDGNRLLAVGTTGTIVQLVGSESAVLSAPTDADLRGVAVRGDEVIVVGEGGTVLHLRGDEWIAETAPITADLNDVAFGVHTALAVGDGGTVLRWDGDHWGIVETETEADLTAVSLTDDASGLVAGQGGTLLTYDGTSLSPVFGAGFRDLLGVDIGEDGQALIVGARGTILRLSDGSLRQMFSPESRDLHGVWWEGPQTAWAVGNRGVVLRLSGDRWTLEDVGYSRNLLAVDGTEGQVLAVGSDPVVDSLSPPSRRHLFGTTEFGQDVFSQTVWGSRTALLVGFLAASLVVLLGTNVGLVAGYFKGRIDEALMRFVDVMYALPFEPFALILVVVFRPSMTIVILAIGLLVWRTNARVIRSQVLSLSSRPFVKAARVAGASDWRILYVHIAPNVLPLVFLQLAIATAFAVSAEATLSFLGLGPPGSFSWGTILFDARLSGAWRIAWWWTAPPGAFITLTILSVFFVARALEVLTNPRLRKTALDA